MATSEFVTKRLYKTKWTHIKLDKAYYANEQYDITYKTNLQRSHLERHH